MLCSAVQRRGWLLVGAGIDQPKAPSPEAVTSWKWPRGRGSRGRQGKNRHEPTPTQDEEKGINPGPANTKARGCTEGISRSQCTMPTSMQWLLSIIQQGGLQVQLWRDCNWRGHFYPSRGNSSDGWEGTSEQDHSTAGCWAPERLAHSLESANGIMLTSLQLVDPFEKVNSMD